MQQSDSLGDGDKARCLWPTRRTSRREWRSLTTLSRHSPARLLLCLNPLLLPSTAQSTLLNPLLSIHCFHSLFSLRSYYPRGHPPLPIGSH